jgi:hypothetical protein
LLAAENLPPSSPRLLRLANKSHRLTSPPRPHFPLSSSISPSRGVLGQSWLPDAGCWAGGCQDTTPPSTSHHPRRLTPAAPREGAGTRRRHPRAIIHGLRKVCCHLRSSSHGLPQRALATAPSTRVAAPRRPPPCVLHRSMAPCPASRADGHTLPPLPPPLPFGPRGSPPRPLHGRTRARRPRAPARALRGYDPAR